MTVEEPPLILPHIDLAELDKVRAMVAACELASDRTVARTKAFLAERRKHRGDRD